MRGKAVIASVTCLAFTMLVVWPRGAEAQPKAATPPAAAPPAGAAATPPADDATLAQARQHFETGRNAYNAGDYVTAIREFKAAEQLRPSPILAYNIGLANEKLGKRRVAVKYYRRYLEQQPNAANKAEVEQKVAALEQEIAAQPPPAATAQPGGTAPPGQAPPGPGAEQVQPGDMPPPDPNATAGVAQPGYDPYAAQAQPGAPVAVKPKKKKSYWWISLIVLGAVSVTVAVAVVAYVAMRDSTTYYYANGALTAMPQGSSRIDRNDIGGMTLFRF